MGIHRPECMDASCKGCNLQPVRAVPVLAVPATPPPPPVMMYMSPSSPPLSPSGSTIELLDHEESKGEWKGTDTACCCCETGGNKLTLTDKRVIIKTWENCLPGCCESSMAEESFDYEEVVHVKVASGRSILYLLVGVGLSLAGVIPLIKDILDTLQNDSDISTVDYASPLFLLVIGVLILGYFVSGNAKAFVTVDFTKDKEVGSFQPSIVSFETMSNPCSLFSCLGKLRRHVTKELKLSKKDAFTATAKICAIRQGLKEKLAGLV